MIRLIAEAGINHCGRIEWGHALIAAAHAAGADVVKFQLYHTETLVRDVENRALLAACELNHAQHRELKQHCEDLGIEWMVSCFDERAVDEAIELGARTIKLGSGELVNHDLLRYIKRRDQPLLLSTGMSTMQEIAQALDAFGYAWGEDGVELLHCVSLYPAPAQSCNLRVIEHLREVFGCLVGFSDHTIGFDAAIAGVGAGAQIIERHIMLDRDCPDEAVSLGPEDFAKYVAAIRRAELMMGEGVKRPQPGELEMAQKVRYRWHVPPTGATRREKSQSGEGHSHGRSAGAGPPR